MELVPQCSGLYLSFRIPGVYVLCELGVCVQPPLSLWLAKSAGLCPARKPKALRNFVRHCLSHHPCALVQPNAKLAVQPHVLFGRLHACTSLQRSAPCSVERATGGMTAMPERDPVEWYTEYDSAAPSAAPEAEHHNAVASIHTLLGSGFSRSTTGASTWGGTQNGARSFFPRLSSLGKLESSPSLRSKSDGDERAEGGKARASCAASSDSPSRSDEEERLHSTSGPSESVSPPARLKRFDRPEVSDRPELDYLDGWTSMEVDEQGPPDPPPRHRRGTAVAPTQRETTAAAAEAEEILRRVADEAAWKQMPETAAGTPSQLRHNAMSPSMSPTTPLMTTTVSGAAQRCVLQCGLELVIVLASFVDIDFLHQVQRRRPSPRTPPPPLPPVATALARRAPQSWRALPFSAGLVPDTSHAPPRAYCGRGALSL